MLNQEPPPSTPRFSKLSHPLPGLPMDTGSGACSHRGRDISRTHPSRDVIFSGQMKLFLYMTSRSLENKHFCRGPRNGAFGKPCFCPAKKRVFFDENGENDEFAF